MDHMLGRSGEQVHQHRAVRRGPVQNICASVVLPGAAPGVRTPGDPGLHETVPI